MRLLLTFASILLIASVAVGQEGGRPKEGDQMAKASTPDSVSAVRLIVETNRGIDLDRTDTELSAVRQKIRFALERASLTVVEGGASKYSTVVRVHYEGCTVGGCSSVLTLTRNGREISKTNMLFGGGRYAYDYPFIGEFTSAMLTNDPSPLLRLLTSSDMTARSAAPDMLAELRQAAVVSALTDALTADAIVRDNSMNALGKIAEKSTDPTLWKPLFVAGGDDEWVRGVFAEHPPRFTTSLLSILSVSKSLETQSAANALARKIKTVSK